MVARVITEGVLERKSGIAVGPGQPVWALGFMTGTSMDGVDAATVLTDGENIEMFGASVSAPFNEAQTETLRRAIDWSAAHWPTNDKLRNKTDLRDIAELREADNVLSESHASATEALHAVFCAAPDMDAPEWQRRVFEQDEQIEIMGFHGQTVLHRPDDGYTLQIGDASRLAEASWFDAPVVHDFRSEDVAAGGQGAPLAPFYHFALAKLIGATAPLAFLNIGGVGNVTWVDPSRALPEDEGALLAFDTGPGNALVNDWMLGQSGLSMDMDGAAAGAGRVHRARLKSNWGREYLAKPGPKSLDRNDFHGVLGAMRGLSVNDGAATLTQYTVDCVAANLRHMPSPPSRWLVCGGGRLNPVMMHMLAERLEAPVEPVEAVGLDGDMLEAQAFAYLAVRVLRGLPTSAPSTTGCQRPICGGVVTSP